MNLSDIRAPKGAKQGKKRKGRGHGNGLGKTGGRGQNGQKSRSGGGVRPGFEGGQMPLHRRLPKFGFTNIFRKTYSEVSLTDLEKLDVDTVDTEVLANAGLLRAGKDGIKILGTGAITKSIKVIVDKVTKSAQKAIEAAGGSVELIKAKAAIVEVDVGKASRLEGDVIDLEAVKKAGLVPEDTERVRLVKRGIIRAKKTYRFEFVSRNARRAVRQAGGKIEEID